MALLMVSNRAFVLMLPLFAIGFLAVDGGSRFVPFYNMVTGISVAFAAIITWKLCNGISKYISYLSSVVLVAYVGYSLYPALKERHNRSAMIAYEVESISAISGLTKQKSTVYSWWDYGYPIMFYSGLDTPTDGGRQGGEGSYIDSLLLTYPNQNLLYNLHRVS